MIARYLLGDLSEAESAQLEDSSFFNPGRLEELGSVENDLIDEYARGELPSQERAKFERLFLANPERRQRVEFAMALARVSSKQGPGPSIIGTRTFGDLFASLFRVPGLIYATVALAVIALSGGWWLYTRTNSRSEQAATRQVSEQEQLAPGKGSSGPSPQVTAPSQPSEIARKGSSQSASNERKPQDNLKPDRGIPHAETTVATFLLLPGASRGGGERTKLVIPPGRQIMRLRLELEKHDAISYRSFAAELSRANSERAWASGSLPLQRNGTLVLNIPVSSLRQATANYDLILRGRSASGSTFETIGYYYLSIVR